MRRVLMIVVLCSVMPMYAEAGGFDDFLKEVLVETSSPAIGSSNDYVFAPGDAVIENDEYAVYYAGFLSDASARTLQFAKVIRGASFTISFPNPQEIRLGKYVFQVVSFDAKSLRLKVVQSS